MPTVPEAHHHLQHRLGHEAGNDAPCGVLPALVSNTSSPGVQASHDRSPLEVMRLLGNLGSCRSLIFSYAIERLSAVMSVAMGLLSDKSLVAHAQPTHSRALKPFATMHTSVLIVFLPQLSSRITIRETELQGNSALLGMSFWTSAEADYGLDSYRRPWIAQSLRVQPLTPLRP